MKVLPLEYVRAHSLPVRPGLLIAIGVIGLLIGGLACIVDVGVAMVWWNAGIGSLPPKPPAPPGPLPAVVIKPYTGDELPAPNGIKPADRPAIIAAFKLQGPVQADLTDILDRLLAAQGKEIFPPGTTPAITPVPPVESDARSSLSTEYLFDVPTGRIMLSAKLATFKSSQQTVAVSDHNTWISRIPEADRSSAAALYETLRAVHVASPSLTGEQLGFIRDHLPGAKATYDNPRYGHGASMAVEIGSLTADGVLTVSIGNTDYLVLRDGRNATANSLPLGINGVTGVPYWTPPGYSPSWPGSPGLMFAQSAHCAVNLLAALLLMFGSYRVLVANPNGTVLLYRWSLFKYTLAVIEIGLVLSYVASLDYYPHSPRPFDISTGIQAMALSVFLQSIFPTVVQLVLRSGNTQLWLDSLDVKLQLFDRQRWADGVAGMGRGPMTLVPRLTGAALMAVALLHLVMAVVVAQDVRWFAMLIHLLVVGVAGASAVMLLRIRPRPQTVAATTLLVVALMWQPSVAVAQTKPADPEVATQVTELLDKALAAPQRTRRAENEAAVGKVIELGEDAQMAAVEWLAKHPTSDLCNRFGIQWRDTGLAKNEALHARALADAQTILKSIPPDNRRYEFGILLALGDEPEAGPMWIKISLGHSIMKRAADTWLDKNDKDGALRIAAISDLAATPPADRNDSIRRREMNDQLLALGDKGIDAVLKNTASDDTTVRAAAIEAIRVSAEKPKAVYNERLADRMIELMINPGASDTPAAKEQRRSIRVQSFQYLFAEVNRDQAIPKLVPLLDEKKMPDAEARSELLLRITRYIPELAAVPNNGTKTVSPEAIRRAFDAATSARDEKTQKVLELASSKKVEEARIGRDMLGYIKAADVSVDTLIATYPNAENPLKLAIIGKLGDRDLMKASPKASKFLITLLDSQTRELADQANRAMQNSTEGRAILAPRQTFEYRYAHAAPLDVEAYLEKEASHAVVFAGMLKEQVVQSPEYAKPTVREAVRKLATAHSVDRDGADRMLHEMFDAGSPEEQWVAAHVLSNHGYNYGSKPDALTVSKIIKLTGRPMEWVDSAGNYRANLHTPTLAATPAPAATAPVAERVSVWPMVVWWVTAGVEGMAVLLSAVFIAAVYRTSAQTA